MKPQTRFAVIAVFTLVCAGPYTALPSHSVAMPVTAAASDDPNMVPYYDYHSDLDRVRRTLDDAEREGEMTERRATQNAVIAGLGVFAVISLLLGCAIVWRKRKRLPN